MKNEVKEIIDIKKGNCKKNIITTNREFALSDTIHEYKDNNGNINYRIDLLLLLSKRKCSKVEKCINKLCSTMVMNVLENHHDYNNDDDNDDDDNYDKITFMIDEEKMKSYIGLDVANQDITIFVIIHDNIGIANRISKYRANNIHED
jgi:hypothetical protein